MVLVPIVVALLGVGALLLGWLQLSGRLPVARRAGNASAYMNIVVGILLLVLAALRYKKLV